ncbi:hypothetical protein BT96DRAFT_19674 [Gymnopus androsaceus JB14]|uniref:Uncharacterized protein n=1 Tax=Gymnopus androsaceus JB14 TaxID=1447944 RepID=A0A6A4IWF1_9AGAR|nr:hypothetical protein BT96DRAFT_19674 [Gymnopus androsaceus JB14]
MYTLPLRHRFGTGSHPLLRFLIAVAFSLFLSASVSISLNPIHPNLRFTFNCALKYIEKYSSASFLLESSSIKLCLILLINCCILLVRVPNRKFHYYHSCHSLLLLYYIYSLIYTHLYLQTFH